MPRPPTPPTDYSQVYAEAPPLHSNPILGSLHLLAWLLFRPSAWRHLIAGLDPALSPDFALAELTWSHWKNPGLWRSLARGYLLLPLLTGLLFGGILLLRHAPLPSIPYSLLIGPLFGLMVGAVFSLAGGIVFAVAFSAVVCVAGGINNPMIGGIAGGIAFGVAGCVERNVGAQMGQQQLVVALERQIASGVSGLLLGLLISGALSGFGGEKGFSPQMGVGLIVLAVVLYILVAILSRRGYRGSTPLGGAILPLLLVYSLTIVIAGYATYNMVQVNNYSASLAINVYLGLVYGVLPGMAFALALATVDDWRRQRGTIPLTRSETAFRLAIAGEWRRGVVLGVAFGVVGYLVIRGLFGAAFSSLFALLYILTRYIAGARAGALAGAYIGGAWMIAVPIAAPSPASGTTVYSILSQILPQGLAGIVGGLSLTWLEMLAFYPILLAWNGLLYYTEEQNPSGPTLLRWHSAFWNENERFPMLGLDRHLVLVAGREPAEAEAAIEFLRYRPQEWAAREAQIELEASALERCEDVQAICKAGRRLQSGKLEGPATALLRSFNRVSLDVEAALNQSSAYNRRLALSAIEERLDGLLRELTRSKERYAVRCRPIASRWRRIVADHIQALAVAVEQRQEIDSPYIIGPPLTEQQDIFIGRTDISARIEQLLQDRRRPPLFLYGQRRMGKTSLLYNLGRLLPSTIVPLFIDLQGTAPRASDYAGFLYNLARSMTESAARHRRLVLPRLTRDMLRHDPFTRFDEWLHDVEMALGESHALLMLDEFEELEKALNAGRFDESMVLGMLRHIIQHRPRFKVLLAGSHTLGEMQRWSSYLINVQVVQIGYLKESEARQLIEQPTPDFALRYEPEALAGALALTRGHPFLVQLLSAEIVALKNEQEPVARRLATTADVEAAVLEALLHGANFFADIERNQISAEGRRLLRFLAAQGEGAIVRRTTLSEPFPDSLDETLRQLLRREVLEQAEDGYRFQVELIRRWFASRERL